MAAETPSRQTYYIHNTSRGPKKRDQRRQAVGPDRSRLNIRIAGTIEVRRGRPLQVGDVVLRRHLKDLIELERKGLVEVYDHRSQRVELTSLSTAMSPSADPNKAKAELARERREASSLIHPPKPETPQAAPEPAPEPVPEPVLETPEVVEPAADTVPPPPPEEEEPELEDEELEPGPTGEEVPSVGQGSTSRRSKKRRK